jgi:DNA-binding CsgD family transcriptional regulator
MCAFGADLRIVEWNQGAENLTGISAKEAIGRPCWAVLSRRADDGSLICHPGCSGARLARKGWPVSRQALSIRTSEGPRRVAVETILSFDESSVLVVHLLRPEAKPEIRQQRTEQQPATLTSRQLEVLKLLAEGVSAREIAKRLALTETTVRNHIQAVLLALGAHSQLQAVFRARCQGLL